MANVTINGLPTAGTIDPVTDIIPIYTANVLATQGINRNTYLGLTSAPVGLTDSQTITNKIIGNTNTITLKDTLFTLQDDGDVTKQAKFQLSGITTSTTRTYSLPNVSDTLVALGATQTLTNKTLTSPSISGGTIDNSTVTVDSVAGHTTSNTGTIYGVSIASGVITSSNSIGAGTIVQGGVSGSQLSTSAISLGYAQITSTFTTSNTTATQVTGLTATVTIPAGGRSIKITALGKDVFSSTAAATITLSIWDGTVGSGTQIAATATQPTAPVIATFLEVVAVVTPAAGTKTYNIGLQTSNGSDAANLEAASTAPAFILVEAI